MDQLSVIETVTLSGRNGDCVLELITGDLSRLDVLATNKNNEVSSCPTAVDLLIVCNEEGGNSLKIKTTSTNLIQNLGSNQQIYLEELSKEEDLRDCLNCWISCPLNKSKNNDNNINKNNKSPFIPFQRILTWEPSIDTLKDTSNSIIGATMAVESIFAAIIAMARNNCRTIVMPLLGLSDDETSQYNMLEAILIVTRKWIKRGLAIERLRIVITETGTVPTEELIDVFKKQSEKLTGSRRNRVREECSGKETAGKQLKKEDELIGIAEPGESDVLCGRGGAALRHPGNQTYRNLVNLNKGLYITCLKTEKLKISRSIVAAIHDKGGRFLERNAKEGTWYDIGDKKAIQKTSQTLREGQPTLRAKMVEAGQISPNSMSMTSEMMMQRLSLLSLQNAVPSWNSNMGMPTSMTSEGSFRTGMRPCIGEPAVEAYNMSSPSSSFPSNPPLQDMHASLPAFRTSKRKRNWNRSSR